MQGRPTNYEHRIVSLIRRHSDAEWLRNQNGSWNKGFQVPFAEMLTTRGFEFSFNVMDAGEVLRVDQ
jgi:hypothetical protein